MEVIICDLKLVILIIFKLHHLYKIRSNVVFVLLTRNLKPTVFFEGNLSFVEAPWQPFTNTNHSPQSLSLIVEMVYW